MKEPTKEWLCLCELLLALEKGNLRVSDEAESFLVGLYENLDPYEPIREQQSEKQALWLKQLWEIYHEIDDGQEYNF